MKLRKYIFGVLALLLIFSVNIVAQEEMTEDEWQAEMNRLREKKEMLTQDRKSVV